VVAHPAGSHFALDRSTAHFRLEFCFGATDLPTDVSARKRLTAELVGAVKKDLLTANALNFDAGNFIAIAFEVDHWLGMSRAGAKGRATGY
jgi:hypothetical protein